MCNKKIIGSSVYKENSLQGQGEYMMLFHEENETLNRIGPEILTGEHQRPYW